MKNFFSTILTFAVWSCVFAQPAQELHKTAKALMMEGDYDNATLVFNKLLDQHPNYTEGVKDFAYLNLLKRDYSKAIDVTKKLLQSPDADEQSYQLMGMCYKAIAQYKEAGGLYKDALKKFSSSGILYSEQAELFVLEKKMDLAITSWEKGIEADPNYAGNYYNAMLYYSQNNNNFWATLYGELFINLESYTTRSAEAKNIILDSYKKMLLVDKKTKQNGFEKAFSESIGNQTIEINANTLTAVRTKFILNWYYNKYNETYPFRLFDQQRYLIREGMFEAYNQWLFGVAQNPANYKTWTENHPKETNDFKEFQQSRIFKLITGQYYRN